MNFVALIRALKFSLQNFWRNIWLSLVTVFILFLTLFSITLSVSLNFIAQKTISAVKERVAVSVYFRQNSLEEDVRIVQQKLASLPQVKDVQYVSRDEALRQFKERTGDNPVIQQTLEALGDNPLGATLIVKARHIDDYPAIVAALGDPSYKNTIEDLDYEESQTVINRLTSITDRIRAVGLAVSIVFSIVAALVIFNTIRITIYSYREEIGIMKLVGASNWFVRAPFILESILYAVIASIVCLAVLLILGGITAPYLNHFFSGYSFDLVAYLQSHLPVIIVLQFGIAILLSVLSSLIAVGRYLRV